ncbi:hypothetical protein ACFOTA_22800 [Chitinophaga sp. GCM10012297]|uniref:MORN repeat variant n=1 Tax=Chitinophaga chungangae TaxID=2821488 RepID=A0ABS3YK58_9BACT|nr:hypothetical protein [Chitinophaga chungangae]MBO9155061.1 hypothetical protein [Chitinophaga chungangae]
MTVPKTFALLTFLLFAGLCANAQKSRKNDAKKRTTSDTPKTSSVSKKQQLFLLDSVEIKTSTEEKLLESQVGFINTVRDPFTLFRLGYGKYDSITFIFTKHYLTLSPEQKNIPSQARLERKKNNRYYFRGEMYTGKVIDYYYSGEIKSEGYYEEGLQKGPLKQYDVNGILTLHNLIVEDSLDLGKTATDSAGNVYYRWKLLLPQGVSIHEYYYPNGALKKRTEIDNNRTITSEYLSSGEMTDSTVFIKGRGIAEVIKTKTTERRERLMKIDEYDVALKREPNNPKIYMGRSRYHIKNLEYAAALEDVNTCIKLEPQEPDYYGERALVPFFKAAYFDTDHRLQKKDVLAYLRAHPYINIPQAEKVQIMKDLERAAVPFSNDKVFKEVYKYLKNINF